MFTFLANLPQLFGIYFAASMSLWTIRLNCKLKSSLVVDWGPQTNRFRKWCFAVLIAFQIWSFWKDSPDLEHLLMWLWTWLCMGLFALYSVLTTIPHQGIYEDGVFLMQKILWMAQGRFIRWSEIQNYRWDEQGRLIINSGWDSMTCKITPEIVDDLNAVLREKCPEAELATPMRMS